jgi:two-component system, chemotaxis family, CheB/CheR fusion protein
MSDASEAVEHSETHAPETDGPVVATAPDVDTAPSALPFPVVGIGASAGGLEPLMELFAHLPADTGIAYVVVPHLAPDQKSHLAEILSHKASMPVGEIVNQTQPEPNRVYILPPNSFVILRHGVLELEPRPEDGRARMPVDHFFRSLAAHQKNRAIGVILSGTDSDGALGLKAIKGEGGIAIVQQPESARFPGMPRSSIAADHVDLIVNPPQIATEIAQLAPRLAKPEPMPKEGATAPDEVVFARILTMLRSVSGVDFRLYKPPTIRRRLARRMMLNKIDSMQDYMKYLQTHPEELRSVHEEALINVTRFFRDPDVFHVLKSEILPRIFDERSTDQQVRIWVPGCSSGEEVYSIAICLLEFTSGQPFEPPIQIFGTDASDSSIERARNGIYPESIVSEVSPDRLRRFFTRVEKGYQISKRVRDLCIFARQNLCNDPPFSKLDLISCRNVLIYFGHSLQRQLIQTFSYALRPNGYLLLGTAETIREFTDLFTLIDRKSKFYAKVASVTPADFVLPNRHLSPTTPVPIRSEAVAAPPAASREWTELELQRAVDRLVLARFGPPGLVINDRLEVVQFRGQTAPLVNMAAGPASLQLQNILNNSIASPVRAAVHKAIEQDAPVRVTDVDLRDEAQTERFAIEVLPVPSVAARPRCFVILFIPEEQPAVTRTAQAAIAAPQAEPGEIDRQENARLKEDLSTTKLYLQSLIEERDARNQELISANEEIQSSNEELQSTNEELETTKEELQSSNEELQTINEELQQRNIALTQTTNDFNNLFTSVNIPVLMLNNELQIRQYTPHTQKLMNIRPTDVGRPMSDIRLNLSLENLELILRDVLETLGTREVEVQDRDGRWHLLRVRPYRTSENKIEGVVLVLVDIDQLRKSQQDLQAARDFARAVTESVGIPIVVLNQDFRIRNVNNAFRELTKRAAEDLEGRSLPDVAKLLWNTTTIRPMLEKLVKQPPNGSALETEHEMTTPGYCALLTRGRVVQIDGEQVILLTIEDITARKQAEQIIEREKWQLEGRVLSTVQALGRTQDELRALSASLFQAQEEERRRVARDLHDDISQRLAVLGMDLQHAAAAAPGDSETRTIIEGLASRTGALADDIRKISHGLHPSMLDDLGLPYALKALGDEFSEREKMLVTWQRQDIPERIPQNVSATLYRIAQEALRNVAKHAGRTHVKISLAGVDGRLRLEIADFGEGFDMEEAHHGLGLISMSERAHLVEGRFAVNSALGKGTTVVVEVPLESDNE